MCVPDQQRNLDSLFAFSAFRILPLCRLVTSLRICGNMRNDSGHVVWRFDQSASFRIFVFAFYFPHSAIPHFTHNPDISSSLLQKLDGQGKARREAARCRNSECKINLSCRNSSRSNDSWRMSPKSTKYSAAATGRRSDQWGSAVNTCSPLQHAID